MNLGLSIPSGSAVHRVRLLRTPRCAISVIALSASTHLASAGLSRVLPTLPTEIDQMILEKLTTEPLAKEAVDLLFKEQPATAECVLNELMKQGLISEVESMRR